MPTIRLFKQHLRLPFLALIATEVFVSLVSVYIGSALSLLIFDYYYQTNSLTNSGSLLPRAILFAIVLLVGLFSMGLYSANHLYITRYALMRRIGVSFILGTLTLTLLFNVLPNLYFDYSEFLISLLTALCLILATRLLFLDIIDRERLNKKVLIYGSGKNASQIACYIDHRSRRTGFEVIGFVHAQGDQNMVDSRVIHHLDIPLVRFAIEHGVREIVVAVDHRRNALPLKQLLECRLRGIEVIDLLTFFERETKKVRLDLVTPSWMIFSDGFRRSTLSKITKRLFDVGASLTLLLLTWPIMLLTAAAILLEDGFGAKIFYRQIRTGRSRKPFVLLKFRSMIENAESEGEARWASQNDDRITHVGKVIRKFRIDELPQIFNVLKNDMSFVGPRPERPEFVKELSKKIPYYVKRHYVKPGITGWAQMRHPYGDSIEDAKAKLEYDLYYTKNYSLFLDLVIMLQTVEVVLFGKGAR